MKPEDLQLGDVIFYNYDPLSHTATHVAMYTGDIDGIPHVTHSVLNATPGVQTTVLKEMEPNGPIEIFRPKNRELGLKAANIMLDWAKYRIPYDIRRANWMIEMSKVTRRVARREDKMEEVDHLLSKYICLAKAKFYERIKFAARLGSCPVRFDEELQARGFTCVQVVILAYQVAELSPYVRSYNEMFIRNTAVSESCEQIKEFWISDKKFPIELLGEYDMPESFISYALALRDQEEFPDFCFYDKKVAMQHENFFPSIVSLKRDVLNMSVDEFIESFASVINLPAKICYTDVLYAYMCKFSDHWEYKDKLDKSLLPSAFSPEAKIAHKKRSTDFSQRVMLVQQETFNERRLSSPSYSYDPYSNESDDIAVPPKNNSPRATRLTFGGNE